MESRIMHIANIGPGFFIDKILWKLGLLKLRAASIGTSTGSVTLYRSNELDRVFRQLADHPDYTSVCLSFEDKEGRKATLYLIQIDGEWHMTASGEPSLHEAIPAMPF